MLYMTIVSVGSGHTVVVILVDNDTSRIMASTANTDGSICITDIKKYLIARNIKVLQGEAIGSPQLTDYAPAYINTLMG